MLWTEELDKQVENLYQNGHTYGQIATMIGVSRNAVIGRMDRIRKSRTKAVVAINFLSIRKYFESPEAKCRMPSDIPIYELRRNECRWPTKMLNNTHLFCAHETREGQVYCEEHMEQAFYPRIRQVKPFEHKCLGVKK